MNYASPLTTRIPSPPATTQTGSAQRRGFEDDWVHDGISVLGIKGKQPAFELERRRPSGTDSPGEDHNKSDIEPASTPHQTVARSFLDERQQSSFQKALLSSSPPTPAAVSSLIHVTMCPNDGDDPKQPHLPKTRWQQFKCLLKTQLKYIGPGITMSVAYCDPGNWSTDLQAGSQFGYPLLFVILLTGVFGIILQVMSLRIGIVCNKDLAVLTREWVLGLGKRSKDKAHNAASAAASALFTHGAEIMDIGASTSSQRALWEDRGRQILLWTLYLVAEGAIICTELAELVGSAIALNLLFPKLPLWAGVLVTSLDVFLILFIYLPETRSIRVFEACIGALVLVVISCVVALVVKVDPWWPDVFHGYLPSSTIIGPQALYVSIGILGATCMPHGLFLGSHFAMFEREAKALQPSIERFTSQTFFGLSADEEQRSAFRGASPNRLRKGINAFRFWIARSLPGINPVVLGVEPTGTRAGDGDPRRASQIGNFTQGLAKGDQTDPRAIARRIIHSTIDVTISMLAFAITTNSALLIVAAQAFYFGIGNDTGAHGSIVVGDLFEAFDLLKTKLNHVSAVLFAIALLAAGQSASITVTLAGQIISEGMINWRTSPFIRRCITRGITLVPSFAVATTVGRSGLDTMLVASQVALSMALPFVLLPLLAITASTDWMRVLIPHSNEDEAKRLAAAPSSLILKITSWSWWTRYAQHPLIASSPAQRSNITPSIDPGARLCSSLEAASSHPYSYSYMHFANSWPMVATTVVIYVIIVLADGFVIVTTAIGTGGAS